MPVYSALRLASVICLWIFSNGLQVQSWRKLPSPVEEGLHGIFFVSDRHGWAFTYGTGKVIHTADGGETWEVQANLGAEYFETIQFLDKKHGWICGDYGYVYKTDDGGQHWMDVSPFVERRVIEHYRSDPERSKNPPDGCFVGYYRMYFFSPEEGFIWGFKFNPAKGAGTRGWIAFTTEDGGKTWQPVPGDAKDYLAELEFSEKLKRRRGKIGDIFYGDDRTGWKFGEDNVIKRTKDSGQTWQEFRISPKKVWFWRGLAFVDEKMGFAIGEESRESAKGVLFETGDGGETWSEVEIDCPALHAIALSPSKIYIVGKKGTILVKRKPSS
jgi:photosystem II stability/assembly factor-like uncharacterized protein